MVVAHLDSSVGLRSIITRVDELLPGRSDLAEAKRNDRMQAPSIHILSAHLRFESRRDSARNPGSDKVSSESEHPLCMHILFKTGIV